jgi:hypothetical protein
MALYRLLAELILVVHLAYVAVVVIGMALILAGIARGWAWVRNFWFRAIHFAMIAVVAAESLAGVACPLTRWEFQLRVAGGGQGQAGSFIGRLVHALMFFGVPRWTFTVSYCLFALVVLATLILAPPRRPAKKGPRAGCRVGADPPLQKHRPHPGP